MKSNNTQSIKNWFEQWIECLNRKTITLIVLLFGYFWIILTDFLAIDLFQNLFDFFNIQLFKGFVFITIAAAGLYFLLLLRDKRIEKSLKEKEALLAEIHHRVKNNLAVISGIAQLQADHKDDVQLQNDLFETVGRIQTIASIHEIIYKNEDTVNLSLDTLIKELASKAFNHVKGHPEKNISYHFDLEPATINVNQAIPVALIINEVLCNALKHAFVGLSKGEIQLSLALVDNQIKIDIRDDGVGITEEIGNEKTPHTLGSKLITTLTHQLEGEYRYKKIEDGTHFSLKFDRKEVKGAGDAQFLKSYRSS